MITVNELFSGIGAQRAALERAGIDHRVVGISEIDKYAIKSYEAIYGATRNYGDISEVESLDYADFWAYSFPCTDISVAGQQKGIVKGETRSGLLYEVQRLLEAAVRTHTQPKWLMLENVKNLVGKKFKTQFEEWLEWLNGIGYNTYWQVLNAKDYGVPQNRERVFAISVRKDVDDGSFRFPEKQPLEKRLKDVLESEVEEKYYLSERILQGFKAHNEKHAERGTGFIFKPKSAEEVASALRANSSLCPTDNSIIVAGNVNLWRYERSNRIYDARGISSAVTTITGSGQEIKIIDPICCASRGRNPDNPSDRTAGIPTKQRLEFREDGCTNTLTTVQKDNYVAVREATKQGYAPAQVGDSINLAQPNSKTRRGCVGKGCAQTLATSPEQVVVENADLRIRKLTPLECWRLMGFADEAFRKAEMVCSNNQLYKQAGNSIVVDVLVGIFKNLFKEG